MITTEMLRDRIHTADAWKCIADTLCLGITPEKLAQSASDEIIFRAFVEGSIKSKTLREKLHSHPFPDINSLGRYSDSDIEYHVGGGLTTAMEICSRAEKHNRPFQSASEILDFGCGTSRILRYMVEYLPGPRYHGSEVFRDTIEWGNKVFPEISYLHQNNHPPIGFPNEKFDIIYAYSIFTHFEEDLHLQWLSELHRILKKNGLVILTIHGEPVIKRCKDEVPVREAMCLGGQNYQKLCEQFYDYGYVFYSCYDKDQLSDGGLDSEIFGITYISKSYVKEKWSKAFEIIEHDEGAISKWQDYVVMKKVR